ncbi:esterase FE4-like isoform X1 [Bombyx mandarina]|uniref:Esterase FE4-like isoform X1 n=2 Tax=Bombyx mandarina TaxID=7092 RepID=A0A6J2KI62_BOMMA|nr:esterase FE4-like isoform X1 [Bombyx mandarina]
MLLHPNLVRRLKRVTLIRYKMSCIVQVEQGLLEGTKRQSCRGQYYYSFEGIPYAKPPIGKLRFSNPQEPDQWKGIRSATSPSNKCAQLNPYSNSALVGSEDCLYLNIYTPSLPAEKLEKLPVIFFVHGGRLIVGYGDYYTPDYLIKNDVILVTLNYRLNVLGFLCLNLPEAPGNVGIKDTVYALRWVGRNISRFNGNPGNITVFGESAGGAIVSSYLTSKMTVGLFSKVIAQSGNSIADFFVINEDPIEKAIKLASVLGKDLKDQRSLYEFLVQVPLVDLVNAFTQLELSRPPSIINAYFLPVVEKKFDNVECFFEEHPIVSIKNNRVQKVPVITGYVTYESALFVQKDDSGKIVYVDDFHNFIPRFLGVEESTERSRVFQKKLREFYFAGRELNDDLKIDYLVMITDVYFVRDIIYFAELLSKHNPEVYLYEFGFDGNLNTRVMKSLGVKGASHGDIVQYQFYRKSKADKCGEADERTIDFLSECWSNFAKYGVPTWRNQKTKWLPYSTNNRRTLVINDEIELKRDVNLNRIKFWYDMIKDKSKL